MQPHTGEQRGPGLGRIAVVHLFDHSLRTESSAFLLLTALMSQPAIQLLETL